MIKYKTEGGGWGCGLASKVQRIAGYVRWRQGAISFGSFSFLLSFTYEVGLKETRLTFEWIFHRLIFQRNNYDSKSAYASFKTSHYWRKPKTKQNQNQAAN